jgi:hypothetical protein
MSLAIDYLVVGDGGLGDSTNFHGTNSGGGGGGGDVKSGSTSLGAGSYAVTIIPQGTTTLASVISAAAGTIGLTADGNLIPTLIGGTSGNGNLGGLEDGGYPQSGGGGGGAGGIGGNGNHSMYTPGPGGAGVFSSISGASVEYGYGGMGGYRLGAAPASGAPATVVIRYLTSGGITATGGTTTYAGGYTIHTFTSSGTFTWAFNAPTLTGLSPATGFSSHVVHVTMTGTNFLIGDSAINISGTGITPSSEVVSGDGLTITVDFTLAGQAACSPGVRTVSVTTSGGTTGTEPFLVVAMFPALFLAP